MASNGSSMDAESVKNVAFELSELANAMQDAHDYAGRSQAAPQHFGSVPEAERHVSTALQAVSQLARSLGGLAGFTADISAKVDAAAGGQQEADQASAASSRGIEGEMA